jgi:hypothetical protein
MMKNGMMMEMAKAMVKNETAMKSGKKIDFAAVEVNLCRTGWHDSGVLAQRWDLAFAQSTHTRGPPGNP